MSGKWPIGTKTVGDADLPSALLEAGRRHARRAVDNYAAESIELMESAAIGVGSALEILAKAYLGNVNTSLLSDERPTHDTRLWLAGQGDLAKSSALSIRTLTAESALKMVKQLVPTFRWAGNDRDMRMLMVRNAATHMGLIDPAISKAAISDMVAVIESLLPSLAITRAEFWGASLSVVDGLLDEAAAEIQRRVLALLASAQAHLAERTKGLSKNAASTVVATLEKVEPMRALFADFCRPYPCPACGYSAWVHGETEVGEPEWSQGPDGDVSVEATVTGWVSDLDCSVCGLHLDYDEIIHLGIAEEVVLEPKTDPDEFREVDEDYYREQF